MIDFERGAKTTGSKFYFTTGEDAQFEWELINEMIQFHVKNGYEFVIPPYLIKEQAGEWAGILPRFEGDYYKTTDGLMLIPTAETPLVGLHANEILNEKDLPKKYVAFSPCFRKEAGTYGKRDKGLRRVHQFHKVELFIICKPEDSDTMFYQMLTQIGNLLSQLKVIWRNVELSQKERSPVSAQTIDFEVRYGNEWLEVSSVSNTEDRQSSLANIRYRPKGGGKNIKVHMLNGSGVALPRLLLALSKEEVVENGKKPKQSTVDWKRR